MNNNLQSLDRKVAQMNVEMDISNSDINAFYKQMEKKLKLMGSKLEQNKTKMEKVETQVDDLTSSLK